MDNSIFSNPFGLVSYTTHYNSMLPSQYAKPSWSIFSDANNDILTFLQQNNVKIEDVASVETFLSNNYTMVAYLYDIPKKVSDYFGDVSLKLGVFSDPDSPDDNTELFVEVETSFSPKQANDKLSKINREWLLKSNDIGLASLNITLKFI